MSYVAAALLGYLFGSIPFGLLLTKLAGLGDIRQIGSGNIGATNVLRTGRRGLAAITLFLDGFKGLVAVLLTKWLLPDAADIAALAALLGHVFPVWLRFKGGKGVSTAVGVVLGLCWQMGVVAILVWSATAYFTRYSSVAAIVAIGLMPLYAIVFDRPDVLLLTVIILFIVITRHRANIGRLLNGTETKIGQKKDIPPV